MLMCRLADFLCETVKNCAFCTQKILFYDIFLKFKILDSTAYSGVKKAVARELIKASPKFAKISSTKACYL